MADKSDEGKARLEEYIAGLDKLLLASQTTIDSLDVISRANLDVYRRLADDPEKALREMGRRTPGARGLADVLRTSARLGSPAAPALARLAHELRADLRRRAEARARTVPVRLCFPLVGCVLPAFALLTVVPVIVAGIGP